MSRRSLSLKDTKNLEVLRRAQTPLGQIAQELNVPKISGQYDFRPMLQSRPERMTSSLAILRLEKDGIVTIVSELIPEEHFNPYQMSVFASTDIQAATLRTQLLTWIHYGSQHLRRTPEQFVKNGFLLVSWYEKLLSDHSTEAGRLDEITYIAGLVTTYYHPHATCSRRHYILRLLQKLAEHGSRAAGSVHELLASHLVEPVDFEVLRNHSSTIERVPISICFKLVKDLYDQEIETLRISAATRPAPYDKIKKTIHARDPKKTLTVILAGTFSDLYSIYCLYVLLYRQLGQWVDLQVHLEIGISDTTTYVASTHRYIKQLRQWFHDARQSIPGLAHLIQSSARQHPPRDFQDKNNIASCFPSDEELALFYLRMLSPSWNAVFVNRIGRTSVLKRYSRMMSDVADSIPKRWKTAIQAYNQFYDFMKSNPRDLGLLLAQLQPLNLLTDKQISDATLILTASQISKDQIVGRFSGGAAHKTIFLGELETGPIVPGRSAIESPYNPPNFFFEAKWDVKKERHVTEVLTKHVVSTLQKIPRERVQTIRLIELKSVSKEAIEAVRQYIVELQQRSMKGDDKILWLGLTFFLAVRMGADPLSSQFETFATRYHKNTEQLQGAVFGSKSRVLPDYAAIEFLQQYFGPRRYVEIEFAGVFRRCNEMMRDLLVKRLAK
jgi:hypothetical protein